MCPRISRSATTTSSSRCLLISTHYTIKNLLEFKAARRVVVTGNTFENGPAGAQAGFAIVITPRNQNGTAPWSVTTDIAVTSNTLINVGAGFDVLGLDNPHPSLLTERILIRNNLVGVTGLNGANDRGFQFLGGGSDYTIDHNTVVNSTLPPVSRPRPFAMANPPALKITNFVFTNNLSTSTH